jgi:hypothetical protein
MGLTDDRCTDQLPSPRRARRATDSARRRSPRGQTKVTPTQPSRLPDALYERAMTRLRVSVGMLTAIELALIARTVLDGLTFVNALAEALTAILLIASLRLRRMGRRLNRDANPSLTGSACAGRADRGDTRGGTAV